MKKLTKGRGDESRKQYKRSDFPELIRGKYAGALRKSSNVVIVDRELTDFFPNSEAVNSALRSLSEIAQRAHIHPRP